MITIKVQCECGQRYAFDVEPVNGQISASVACPACGADGTAAANTVIAQNLNGQFEAPSSNIKLRTATPTIVPIARSSPTRAMPHAPVQPFTTTDTKLTWYEHLWIALPLVLIAVGGAIGGACGGAAWGVNRKLFKKIEHPFLRYLWTGLISVAAGIVYLVIAMSFLPFFKKQNESEIYNWKTFTSQEGNFSALFPGPPTEKMDNEIFLKVHSFTFEKKKAAFLVIYSDFPEKLHVSPTDKLFEGSRNGALGGDGKLLQEKPITIEGYLGREIQFEKPNKGNENFVVDRYFLAANRMYQIMVVVPKQDHSSTNISYFLNSFGLLKK